MSTKEASNLTKDQDAKLRKEFYALDTDRDGSVSHVDVTAWVLEKYQNLTKDDVTYVKSAIHGLGDLGQVDSDIFIEFMASLQKRISMSTKEASKLTKDRDAELRNAFHALDTDRDGSVSHVDVTVWVLEKNHNLTKDEVMSVISALHGLCNGDHVDIDTFIEFMASIQAFVPATGLTNVHKRQRMTMNDPPIQHDDHTQVSQHPASSLPFDNEPVQTLTTDDYQIDTNFEFSLVGNNEPLQTLTTDDYHVNDDFEFPQLESLTQPAFDNQNTLEAGAVSEAGPSHLNPPQGTMSGAGPSHVNPPQNQENAGEISNEQINMLKEAFRLFDKNRDGVITPEDLGTVMRSIGQNPTEEELKKIIAEVDDEGKGSLNLFDFMKVLVKVMKDDSVSDEYLTDAFNLFDTNRVGYFSVAELRVVMLNLGETLTDEELADIIKKADFDGDGRINFEEFKKMMLGK